MNNQKIHKTGAPGSGLKTAQEDHSRRETYQNNEAVSSVSHARSSNSLQPATPRLVSAGQWMREVTGFKAPFGHDGLPTVWG
ncbi:MAG TPA: hypothetical protein VF600_09740 [Abditibacteriaceae bacterium]|jgi:hypothetical protein